MRVIDGIRMVLTEKTLRLNMQIQDSSQGDGEGVE